MLIRTVQKISESVVRRMTRLIDACSLKDTFEGINIIDLITEIPDGEDSLAFIPTAKRALSLILDRDPLRFRRLQESLISIRSLQSELFPVHDPSLRSCHLNYESFRQVILAQFRDEPGNQQIIESVVAAELATALVHQATRGFLATVDSEFAPGR